MISRTSPVAVYENGKLILIGRVQEVYETCFYMTGAALNHATGVYIPIYNTSVGTDADYQVLDVDRFSRLICGIARLNGHIFAHAVFHSLKVQGDPLTKTEVATC